MFFFFFTFKRVEKPLLQGQLCLFSSQKQTSKLQETIKAKQWS